MQREKHGGEVRYIYLGGEGSQASPARPSDDGSMRGIEVKTLGS
jgi:hypothetical protein